MWSWVGRPLAALRAVLPADWLFQVIEDCDPLDRGQRVRPERLERQQRTQGEAGGHRRLTDVDWADTFDRCAR